jgi:hypothetical protein
MFEHYIAYRMTIIMCYSRQTKVLTNRISSTQFWSIDETIFDELFPIVTTCIINQHRNYWFLFNVFASAIRLYVQLSKDRLILQAKVNVA